MREVSQSKKGSTFLREPGGGDSDDEESRYSSRAQFPTRKMSLPTSPLRSHSRVDKKNDFHNRNSDNGKEDQRKERVPNARARVIFVNTLILLESICQRL